MDTAGESVRHCQCVAAAEEEVQIAVSWPPSHPLVQRKVVGMEHPMNWASALVEVHRGLFYAAQNSAEMHYSQVEEPCPQMQEELQEYRCAADWKSEAFQVLEELDWEVRCASQHYYY